MILLDTSAWIEYLRDSGSDICEDVDDLIAGEKPIATCDAVILELLAGTKSHDDWKNVWALMNRCRMLPVRPLFDYEVAAALYRQCRRSGFTPANTNDLLIAAVAIGKNVPVLAADADFEKIASVSRLKLAS